MNFEVIPKKLKISEVIHLLKCKKIKRKIESHRDAILQNNILKMLNSLILNKILLNLL